MVNIRATETINTKEGPTPVMHRHSLRVLKDAPGGFKRDANIICLIAKYDNGRYCVFTASFIKIDHYHVFDSLEELHETFEELSTM
jgi:hypothetical protein